MVSHASKDWRHCGLCDYEFYSDNGGTPNHLRLVAFKTQEETENREPSLMGEGSSTDAWPLPAELMWRMILTHESLHRARLFPARKVPYLPINLIDQLITSCAIQGSMASYWLIRRAKEEVEGVQKDDDNMGGSAGMKTTQDMFMSGPEQRKCIIVDEDEVDAARVTLIRLIRPESWSEPGAETMRARMMSLRKPSHQLASISAKLPAWLAQHFNELGERNAAKQVEMDFVDNL